MADLVTSEAPAWYQWVIDFDNTWKSFNDNYHALLQLQAYIYTKHPELRGEYDALVARGQSNYNTLLTLKETRDTVSQWLSSIGATVQNVLNFTGIQAGVDWVKERFGLSAAPGESGLGFLPVVIGVAAAAAALAAVAYWITDAWKFAQKTNAMIAAEQRGATPAQAAALVNSLSQGGSIFGVNVNLLLVAGLAVLLAPPIFRMIERRRLPRA